MTCSPDQSLFTAASKVETAPNGKEYISELDYAVNLNFADGLYQSCKNVSNPTTGSKALDIICGNWPGGCNATNWITFLTDRNVNSMVPFQINIKCEEFELEFYF